MPFAGADAGPHRCVVAGGPVPFAGVILAAQGPVFSAGHHFADMAGADAATLDHLFAVCTRLMQTLQAIPQPVVAQVHALANGSGLLPGGRLRPGSSCRLRRLCIARRQGWLFCHTPGGRGGNIGRKRALEMVFTGDPIDAATAADWGLVNQVVPAARLASATRALIERASRASVLSGHWALGRFTSRSTCRRVLPIPWPAHAWPKRRSLPDAQEGMTAFWRKRPPQHRQWPGDDLR